MKVHRAVTLPEEHVVVRGVRVTTVPRTICDLASTLAPHELEVLFDHALSRRRVTCAQVRATLGSLSPNVCGRSVLARLLDARSDGRARAESPLEQRVHALLRRGGLLRHARLQHVVDTFRLDVAFPASRLALEIDGYRHHSSRTDWARDHKRHATLSRAAGACSP